MRKASLFLVLALALLGAISFWRIANNKESSRAEFIMGTYMEIRAFGKSSPQAVEAVFVRLKEIESRMTQKDKGSEIAAVRDNAGISPTSVSADTFLVTERALYFAELTEGRFDPTIQPIEALWAIGSPQARKPDDWEIAAALPLVDYRQAVLNEDAKTVFLKTAGMGLDLGAIAKGYAADETIAILRSHDIKRALVDLGGNLYALGTGPEGKPWRIGIQDPEQQNNYVAVVEVTDETLVTSGAYERFFVQDGIIYHHILDPDTGFPAITDILSVTIVAKNSMDADALSTGVFILGSEAGLKLINSIENVEAVIIDKDYRVTLTPGLQDRVTITDAKYRLLP